MVEVDLPGPLQSTGHVASDPVPIASDGHPLIVATALRRVVASGHADGATWQAYGDALYALGFLARAEQAWCQAGVMPKLPAGPIASPPAAAGRDGSHHGIRFHLSTRQPPPDEQDRIGMARGIGTSDYSYGFAMRKFHAAIARIGLPCTVMRHPEYIADIRDRSDAACNIHLTFYPPEQMRLLKGAYNIACFAWEFDRLRTPAERPDPHAFADQATMLSLMDELWLPSRHGVTAVAGSVSVPAYTVPAPVIDDAPGTPRRAPPDPDRLEMLAGGLADIGWQRLAILPAAQATMDHLAAEQRQPLSQILATHDRPGPAMLFVTVLNVHDYRKQLHPMLEGFIRFSQTHPTAMLLVKASTPHRGVRPINDFLLHEQIVTPGERPRSLASDRIWITDEVLTRAEMAHFYDAGAFYLCTSHAEGQNLPLLEAMARGVVPVSVDHTAMADYIRPDNAVPIQSTRRPFGLRLSRRYGMAGLDTNFVTAGDVHRALLVAAGLDDAEYAARSGAARATVRRDYGTSRLAATLQALIARVAPVAAVG